MSEHVMQVETQDKNKRMLVKLSIVAVAMLAFGVVVMPWFYNLTCAYIGADINPDNDVTASVVSSGTGEAITVSFEARVLDDLPVRFYAEHMKASIKPGETGFNTFYFQNISDDMVYLRPIHTVSPNFAATAFDMQVCFCFNDQTLEPGEKKEYEIQYSFSEDMDTRVVRAIVRYDLHKIEQSRMRPFQEGNIGVPDQATVDQAIEAASDE